MSFARCRWITAFSINASIGPPPSKAILHRKSSRAGAAYPDVPALIISGELDNMTTIADGAPSEPRVPARVAG